MVYFLIAVYIFGLWVIAGAYMKVNQKAERNLLFWGSLIFCQIFWPFVLAAGIGSGTVAYVMNREKEKKIPIIVSEPGYLLSTGDTIFLDGLQITNKGKESIDIRSIDAYKYKRPEWAEEASPEDWKKA